MLKMTLAGLRAHLLRLVLTTLAITLGVGFVSGTFVLTDTMQAGFDQQFTASADKVSVAALDRHTGERDDPGLSPELLTKVKGLSGVQDAQGLVRGTAPLVGKDGKVYGEGSSLGLSISTGALQRYQLKSGHLPTGPDTAVLETKTAQRTGFGVGDTIKVLDPQNRPRTFTVSGVMDFAVDQSVGYYGAVGYTPEEAAAITGERGFAEIDVRAAPGTEPRALRDAVAQVAGGSVDVLTGDQLAQRLSNQAGVSTDDLALFFLAFAIVALFVAALVIYNTFNILLAQRTREMALLRCVGATRAQVFRSVLIESVIVGFFASALGVIVGIGLGTGGAALFSSAEASSSGPVTVTATPLVAGMLAGLVVTVLSALLPARAATRVPPIAALRTQTEGPVKGRAGVVRMSVGVLTVVLGLALFGLALVSTPGQGPFLAVLAGSMAIFFGFIALSPFIVGRLSVLIGWLPARTLGVPGKLARDNAGRNPKRAAITTVALTVGVTLMTMFSVALVSMQASTTARLDAQFPMDYQLTSVGDRLIPRQIAADLRTKPQLAEIVEERRAEGRLSGRQTEIGAVTDHALGHSIKPDHVVGSLTGLRPGTVALGQDTAKSFGVGVGGRVSLGAGTSAIPLTVAAVFDEDSELPSVTVTEQDFQRAFGAKDDSSVAIIAKKGVSADESRKAVEAATDAYPAVKVGSLADVKAQFTKGLDQLLLLVAALLGLAVLISLIGIANTLTLSVVERTHESALLRALGLTRRGLRWMLSLEAVIMAVIGALTGVVLGTGFGWAAVRSVLSGAVLSFPVGRVVAFVLIAGLAGLLAAVVPSRRAARASIVESLAAD